MNIKSINPLLAIGLTGIFIIGSSFFVDLYNAFYGDKNIYWTHQSMKMPIEKTKNDFEIYIGEKLLQKQLSDKTIFAVDKDGKQYPVVSQDITVRLNNYNSVKSAILTRTTFTGFAFGISLTLFIIGLFHRRNIG
jgi:hypothetical protein